MPNVTQGNIFRADSLCGTPCAMGWILGDKFDTVYPHKGSIKALWETKWRAACEKSVYPFHDGRIEDFEPIFKKLISQNINDASSPEYTATFLPIASNLEQRAIQASLAGQSASASTLLLRASAIYRISRFPYVSPNTTTTTTDLKRTAFERQKQAYLKAASFWSPELEEATIPHTHRTSLDKPEIPLYIRIPSHASPESPVPAVLIITGLDGYRPDNTQRTHELTRRGWAVFIAEIPGTADCPADPADPASADRLWDSVLEYISSRNEIDSTRIAVWGLSAGGYYAVRAAHTHADKLIGCVAHGPGVHYFLDPGWLARVEDHEYPFPILDAWAEKYGFANVEAFCAGAQGKFSLLRSGVLERPCSRLLLLNGVDDGIVPIEDCLLLFNHGSAKEGRFYPGLPHMGYPDSLAAAYKWLEEVLGTERTS
ncbi:Alpha/Beta hydrolase protein [Aspergillus karnatakaensis]|uniref:heptaketide hydrolyase ayg1 n=1 Tax=Aspergillus karnatakaensis TaxID=1810916 RepID=UPI003CCCCA90